MRKHLSTFKLFLKRVLIKFLKFFYTSSNIILFLLYDQRLFWDFNCLLLFCRMKPRIGQIVKIFIVLFRLLVSLHLKFSLHDSLKIVFWLFLVSSGLLLCIDESLPSYFSLLRSCSNFFWHALIFFSISFISAARSSVLRTLTNFCKLSKWPSFGAGSCLYSISSARLAFMNPPPVLSYEITTSLF